MTDLYEGEEEMDRSQPDFNGPYDAEKNGRCAFTHPLNGFGRCEPLNKIPRECPPKEE